MRQDRGRAAGGVGGAGVWRVGVERVGGAIANSQIFPTDPSTFADTRVVPVYIRLADSAAAAGLIHGKVSVVIRP